MVFVSKVIVVRFFIYVPILNLNMVVDPFRIFRVNLVWNIPLDSVIRYWHAVWYFVWLCMMNLICRYSGSI